MSIDVLQAMCDHWNVLAERHDLLKQYLLRPYYEAMQMQGGSIPQNIEKCNVLPASLFSAMQDAYHQAIKDIEDLERELSQHENIRTDANGAPRIVSTSHSNP